MKNDFMSVKNLTDTSADLYFYGDIVSSEWGKWEDTDTAPEDVRNILNEVKDVQQLNIYINSGGGSVFAGLAIYNMLKRHQGNKTVYVDGLAASIASVIAMAGDKVVIPSNAFLMIHKPWSVAIGNSDDFMKMAEDLEAIEGGIMNIYEENMAEGADIETIRDMVKAETWLNGREAGEFFNIEIAQENRMAASASDFLDKYYNVPKNLKVAQSINEQEQLQNEIDLLGL